MLWTQWRHGTHPRTLADTCLLLCTLECAGFSLTLDGLSPTLSYLRSLSRPTSMAPSDSPSEPLGALGRFIARAGSGVSALRSEELVVGPRPGPAPGSRHRPFPGPFPAPQPGAPRRPLAPAVTRHRTVGRPRAVTAPIGRWEVRLRSTGAAWTGALGGLGQVPWEAPRGKPRQTLDLSPVYVRQASLCSASALGGTDLHLPAPWGPEQTDRFGKVTVGVSVTSWTVIP